MGAPEPLVAALGDRYSLTRAIGAGGMATVYLAQDLRHGRQVAIKVLKREVAVWIGPDRFHSEIRTTAGLQHPSILPLFDSGEAAGLLFYVMPYVSGGTLRTRLAGGPAFSRTESLGMIAELAMALEYAHRRGLVHRDVKPENILLHEGRALLSDFGIALRTTENEARRMTEAGIAVGTRGYMSPEQHSGQRDIDGRSDQYSLACVLAEMLAEPRLAHQPSGDTVTQDAGAVASSSGVTRPEGLDPELDGVLARATARDPRRRFDSMQAFAEALRAIAAGRSTAANKSIAVLAFENMSGDRENDYFGEGMSEEIINALARLPRLHVVARATSFSFKGVRDDLREIGRKLHVGFVLEGSVRKSGERLRITVQLIDVESGFQVWSERYDRTLHDVFAIQDEIATTIASKLEVTLGGAAAETLIRPGTRNLAAYEEYLRGTAQMHRRGAGLLEAIECFGRAIETDPGYAPALAGLAHALVLSSFWGLRAPAEIGPPATDAARRALLADPSSAEAHASAALVALTVDYDRTAAAAAWERAMALAPGSSVVRGLRAVFHHCYVRRDLEGAIRELRLALDSDPLNAFLHCHIGQVLSFGPAPRVDEALAEADRALTLDPEAMYPRWIRVIALTAGRHWERAAEEALDTMRRLGRHGWFMQALAVTEAKLGRKDVAQALYDEMIARSRTEHVQRPILAVMALAVGRREEAVALWIRSVEERDPLMVAYLLQTPLAEDIRSLPEHHALLQRLGWDKALP